MNQIVRSKRKVNLNNSFEGVWTSLFRIGKDVELITEGFGTAFVVRACMAKRSDVESEVLLFLRRDETGKVKECSRCYAKDWGFYFNHLGSEGQRIGMYCKAIDDWVTRNALRNEFD